MGEADREVKTLADLGANLVDLVGIDLDHVAAAVARQVLALAGADQHVAARPWPA